MSLTWLRALGPFLLVLLSQTVLAQVAAPPPPGAVPAKTETIEFKSKKYTGNFETGITKALGEVKIILGDQTIFCDEAEINQQTSTVVARGNVVFTQGKLTLKGENFTIDMKTGFGVYHKVIMTVGKELRIEAVELTRVETDRFIGKNVKMSSCIDCPESWSVAGTFVDLRTDSFAEIHNAIFQVKDIPISYMPIFIFPTTSKRRSGFLIPQFANQPQTLGFEFMLPYYWVHSDWSDSTTEYRYMSEGGHRIANEIRTLYSERTFLTGTTSYVKDLDGPRKNAVLKTTDDRYGYSLGERAQLSPHLTQRFIGEIASDTSYTTDFEKEFPSHQLPSLVNEPSLTWQNDNAVAFGRLALQRDNLPRIGSEHAIQKMPELEYAIPSYSLFGALRGSASLTTQSYRRFGEEGFDKLTDWIRTGDRGTARARLSAPETVGGILDWNPSVEMRTDLYRFPSLPSEDIDPSAYRGRIYFDQTLGTRLSRVYNLEGSDLKAIRHTIEPSVRWSYSPPDLTKRHPFFDNAFSPRFDLFDPGSPDISKVSLGNIDEEQRLGDHHLLTLGLGSRIVGRYGTTERSYQEFLAASVEQDINFWVRPQAPDRLSRLRLNTTGAYAGISLTSGIAIDLKSGDTNFRNTMRYAWTNYILTLDQTIDGKGNNKDEKYGAGLAIKGWGPWSFTTSTIFDAPHNAYLNQAVGIAYDSSSHCWGFAVDFFRATQQVRWDKSFKPTIRFSFKEIAGN